MKTETMTIQGMHCKSCVTLLTEALTDIPGVAKATVSLERQNAEVTYDPTKVDSKRLREAIAAEGYEAR